MKICILKKTFIHVKLHFQSKIGETRLHFCYEKCTQNSVKQNLKILLQIWKLLPNHTVFQI